MQKKPFNDGNSLQKNDIKTKDIEVHIENILNYFSETIKWRKIRLRKIMSH